MYSRKRYGQSRIDNCPFCGKAATAGSVDGVPVCSSHRNERLPEMKCVCGSFLELRKGKFGAFFSCIRCGNVNFAKAIEVNDVTAAAAKRNGSKQEQKGKKEVTVRSDELDFLY